MLRLLGGGFLCCGVHLVLIGIVFVGLWKTFEKMGKPGWAGIVPIYNIIVLLEVVRKPMWWIALFLIPFVGPILVGIEVAKCFGKEGGFGVGLGLLPFVFYPILGFGSARFVGPEGSRLGREDIERDELQDGRSRPRDGEDHDDRYTSGKAPSASSPQSVAPAPSDGTIMIQCSGCQRRLKVPANVIGKKVKCPACGAAFVAG